MFDVNHMHGMLEAFEYLQVQQHESAIWFKHESVFQRERRDEVWQIRMEQCLHKQPYSFATIS